MKYLTLLFLAALLSLIFSSCQEKDETDRPVVPPSKVLKTVMTFLEYRQKHVAFQPDFVALDKAGRPIPRELFFRYLSTGRFLPLRLAGTDERPAYRLHKMEASVDPELRQVIKDWGKEEYALFQTEGTPFPDFSFTDLSGNRYTKKGLLGKTVVLKCWFVACLPCRQEMPALNALKQEFKNREDVVFISLCLDNKAAIDAFLRTTRFDYPVVPAQDHFIAETLQVNAYPTHFVIDKKGRIVKKTTDHKTMEAALRKSLDL